MTLRKRVVVTGLGILSSIGSSPAEFKRRLLARECGIRPSEKFLRQFENANASEVLEEPAYEGLAPELRTLLDKTSLWAYKVGRDALLDAHLLGHPVLDKTLLAVGLSSSATECFMPLIEDKPDDFSWQRARVCGTYGSVCSVVSSLLGTKGGFELVATACTASTNAIGVGFDYIQSGQKTALIIGTEPLYLPTFAGFFALKAMHERSCSPFSGTPGMSIGEGAGAVVLEDYEHAKARGATIYGEILSYATSSDAYHETAPDPRAQAAALVMNTALTRAGLTPLDIDYINAHGTGTEANDRAETLAMKKVFPNILDIPVSSTKSYFGHNIGAAGIVELIACLSVLREGVVLPTLNFAEPRIGCDLNFVPNEFQRRDVKVFMKNNYAFGGNNCSLITALNPEAKPPTEYRSRHIAITGIGAVSSLGYGIADICERIWAGVDASSIKQLGEKTGTEEERIKVEKFMASMPLAQNVMDEANRIADITVRHHEIQNLDVRRHLKNFDGRRANKISMFTLLALEDALAGAGLKLRRDNTDTALIMGMSRGPQSTEQRLTESLHPDPKRIRTLEFATSLMNSSASFCSIAKGLKGYNTTFATGVNASLGALCYGFELIRQEAQSRALVGGADEAFYGVMQWMKLAAGEISRSSHRDGFRVYSDSASGCFLGEGAVVACLEDADAARERNAPIAAMIAGYGRSCDATMTMESMLDCTGAGLASAIHNSLTAARLSVDAIDLVCGTGWGTAAINDKETSAIRQVFGGRSAPVPVVNYNAHFGMLESAAGLLNLAVVLEVMRRGEILPIPHTQQFCANDLFFVRERLSKPVNHALIVGSSDGGNNYAVVLSRVAADA